jgi:hypothetical protein
MPPSLPRSIWIQLALDGQPYLSTLGTLLARMLHLSVHGAEAAAFFDQGQLRAALKEEAAAWAAQQAERGLAQHERALAKLKPKLEPVPKKAKLAPQSTRPLPGAKPGYQACMRRWVHACTQACWACSRTLACPRLHGLSYAHTVKLHRPLRSPCSHSG